MESSEDDFKRGAVDLFWVQGPRMGEITEAVLEHDGAGILGGSDWHCKMVEVLDEAIKQKTVFWCDQHVKKDILVKLAAGGAAPSTTVTDTRSRLTPRTNAARVPTPTFTSPSMERMATRARGSSTRALITSSAASLTSLSSRLPFWVKFAGWSSVMITRDGARAGSSMTSSSRTSTPHPTRQTGTKSGSSTQTAGSTRRLRPTRPNASFSGFRWPADEETARQIFCHSSHLRHKRCWD